MLIDLKTIGLQIRQSRQQLGISQAGLAHQAGVSRATIIGIENGTIKEIGVNRLNRIVAASRTSPRPANRHGNRAALDDKTCHARAPSHALPHPTPPPEGEGSNKSRREFHVNAPRTASRKSENLNLSFPYDWSNPAMTDSVLIGKVVERGLFEDMAKVAVRYGVDPVRRAVKTFTTRNRAAAPGLTRMLTNIEKALHA